MASEDLLYVGSREGSVLALDIHSGAQLASFPPREDERLEGIYGTPVLADGTLYVSAFEGKLYALNATTLSLDWEYPVDEGGIGRIVGGPTVAEGLVIFGSSDGYVRAVRNTDGSLAWSFQTQDSVWSTPTVEGDTVYISSLDHHVYALSLTDGRQKWPRPFEAEGAVVSSPLVVDGKLYVGSFDRNFYVLDAISGTVIDRFEGDSWFWANPITDGQRVYAASMGGTLYTLDIGRSPLMRELFDLGSPIVSTPVLVDGRIAITSDGGLIYLISPDTGKQEAPAYNVGAEVRAALGVRNDTVYVNAMDRRVWALQMGGSQEKLWQIATNVEGQS